MSCLCAVYLNVIDVVVVLAAIENALHTGASFLTRCVSAHEMLIDSRAHSWRFSVVYVCQSHRAPGQEGGGQIFELRAVVQLFTINCMCTCTTIQFSMPATPLPGPRACGIFAMFSVFTRVWWLYEWAIEKVFAQLTRLNALPAMATDRQRPTHMCAPG